MLWSLSETNYSYSSSFSNCNLRSLSISYNFYLNWSFSVSANFMLFSILAQSSDIAVIAIFSR